MADATTMKPLPRIVLGTAVAGLGLFMEGIALGWIPSEEGSVHAPPWVLMVISGLFVLLGVWLVTAPTPVGRWLGRVVGPLTLVGLLSVLHWVAFGAGPRRCTGGVSLPFLSAWWPTGEMQCRAAFGYGALLFDGVLLSVALGKLAEGREGAGRAALEFGSKAVLLVVLAPFLVFLILYALGAEAWKRLRKRVKTTSAEADRDGSLASGPPPGSSP